MVIGHTSDVDPYALYRRVFFRTLGITPPESDLKHFVIQTLPFRAMFRLPPALTSYFSRRHTAAPVGIELCLPLPDVSACNSLHRLGLAVLMVIGHTSDVDPYALYRRVFFRTLGITPPESDLKHFVIQTLPFRAMFRLPPALTSYFSRRHTITPCLLCNFLLIAEIY